MRGALALGDMTLFGLVDDPERQKRCGALLGAPVRDARDYLKGANPADPYASPVSGNMRDFPPIIVHAGSHKLLRDDASRLGELAASYDVPVSVEIYDGMPHLFQGSPTASEAKVSLNRLGQFIRARTKERAQTTATLKNVKQVR